MPDFESQVRHSLVIADSSENAVRAIVAAHTLSLASIIGDDSDESDDTDPAWNDHIVENRLRAKQRKRAGM